MKKNEKIIVCTICEKDNLIDYALLSAVWGKAPHKGENYELYLCETCFFGTLSHLKIQKRMMHIFDENFEISDLEKLGLA